MCKDSSSIATPKKRGRPPILKQYSDPMKSPMAQSSLQVQKTQQSFNKPLMRVGNSPTKFKTPQRKRRSSTDISPPSSATGSTKKGRYKGVVMSSSFTAKQKGKDDAGSATRTSRRENDEFSNSADDQEEEQNSMTFPSSSAPGTPMDQVFSSISRAHNVKSSPPIMFETDSPIQTKRKLEVEIDQRTSDEQETINNRLKFMLNVGKNGKACIEANSLNEEVSELDSSFVPPKHLLETPVKMTELYENGVARFDKKRVMGFLRQMKSKNKTLDDKPLPEQTKNFTVPSSPSAPPNSSGNITEPLTPRCTQLLQFKTGFTPNFNIDELLVSPKLQESLNKNLFRSPNQYVFKVSSGDPLLINDHQETELISGRNQDVSDMLSFLNSPKRPSNLNTPPSYLVNFNSPRSNSRLGTSSFNTAKFHLPSLYISKQDSNQQHQHHHHVPLPSTPLVKLNTATPLQFTPIIQKQMNGETKFSVTNSIEPINLRKDQNKILESNDDARACLLYTSRCV